MPALTAHTQNGATHHTPKIVVPIASKVVVASPAHTNGITAHSVNGVQTNSAKTNGNAVKSAPHFPSKSAGKKPSAAVQHHPAGKAKVSLSAGTHPPVQRVPKPAHSGAVNTPAKTTGQNVVEAVKDVSAGKVADAAHAVGADKIADVVKTVEAVKAQVSSQSSGSPVTGQTDSSQPAAVAQPSATDAQSADSASPATQSTDTSSAEGDFVSRGQIPLFGDKSVTAELEEWQGPPPSDVTLGTDKPSIQKVLLKGDFHLSAVIPSLKGSEFDEPLFRNVTVLHQNYPYDDTMPVGWSISADLVIDKSSGTLYHVLCDHLGITDPTVTLTAGLGPDQSLTGPVNVHELTLQGVLTGANSAPVNGVHFTTIGAQMHYVFGGKAATTYDFAVYGSLNLTVPASVTPLELDYTLEYGKGSLNLTATIPEHTWEDPMGAVGVTLDNVTFSASLDLNAPWKTLTFDIEATLDYQSLHANFSGEHTPGGDSHLTATVQNFDLDSICDIFDLLFHDKISPPKVDVTIESAIFSIASGQGLQVTLQNVQIEGHCAGSADVSITSTGVVINGNLLSGSVTFDAVTITKAYLDVQLESAKSGKDSAATLGGEVTFEGFTFDAAVHLYYATGNAKNLQWAVVASLTADNDSLALSRIAPELKGGPFDLALTNVLFVAASQDDPDLGNTQISSVLNGSLRQGVQICASLDEIGHLNDLTRSHIVGLTLNASWSKAEGFNLEIALPSPIHLNLGHGITTTPIDLIISTKPPGLMLTGGLNIPVAHSPTPLVFSLDLAAYAADASLTAELKGWWPGPFGLSPRVEIGPDLALEIDIDYAQFLSTGLISGLAFEGGLMIGSVNAQVAISINDDPMKELLYAEVKSLNLDDVIDFARNLTRLPIPRPPADVLEFADVKVYICPAGLTIGSVSYPEGFSFSCDMVVFGKHADISCSVGDTGVSISGAVDSLQVGPLSVRGYEDPRPTVACTFDTKVQSLLFDGEVTFFGDSSAIHVEVQTMPTPTVTFDTTCKFTDLFTFSLQAELSGSTSLKDLKDAEFDFKADMEQHVLQYIRDHVVACFDKAREVEEGGITSAQKKVTAAQQAVEDRIKDAQLKLNAAEAAWEAKNTSVTAASNKVIADNNAKIAKLQDDIDRSTAKYNAELNKAQQALDNANHDRAVKMAAAQKDVTNAEAKLNSSIKAAQDEVDRANAAMNRDFGNAESKIQNAENKVNSLQNKINGLEAKLRSDQHGKLSHRIRVPGIKIEIAVVDAAMKIADGLLHLAQDVLKSSNYIARKGGIDLAEKALELARVSGDAGLKLANDTLKGIDAATKAAIDAADETIKGVEKGGDKIALDGAVAALELYKKTSDLVVKAAADAVKDLMKSGEYLAYEAASAALAAAKAGTAEVSVVNKAMDVVKDATADVLSLGKIVIERGAEALDIQSVKLSGHLGKSTGSEGPDSLSAAVQGLFMDKPFSFDLTLDPKKPEQFIVDAFKSLWEKVKKDLHL